MPIAKMSLYVSVILYLKKVLIIYREKVPPAAAQREGLKTQLFNLSSMVVLSISLLKFKVEVKILLIILIPI